MRIARVADPEGRVFHAAPAEENGMFLELRGNWAEGFSATGRNLGNARLLAPVDPSAIYAIGLNYRDHARETGAPIPEYPVLFVKNVRSVIGPGETIRLPRHLRSDEVDAEAELAVERLLQIIQFVLTSLVTRWIPSVPSLWLTSAHLRGTFEVLSYHQAVNYF